MCRPNRSPGVIVVATADFEVYHGLIGELRDRGVPFTTIEPEDSLPESADAVLTTESDPTEFDDDIPVIQASPSEPRAAVERALVRLRKGDGRTVIGVDPGDRPGIAVLSGSQVVAAFQVPLADAPAVIKDEVADATDPIVRIGDGSRLRGAQVIDALPEARVELVDETGTTPHLGTGARGMGDVLAAVNIARLSGEVVDEVTVEPTDGEIQAVKNRSRERTGTDTLTEALARRVAEGELTLTEAIDRHRSDEAE